MTATRDTAIDICLCTFRRPHLARTLDSLAAIALPPDAEVGLIVVDNDTGPTARDIVEAFARRAPFPVLYAHCPAGNISIARNGALDRSEADLVAFIDDDELATPGWLAALHAAMAGADVALGPVRADYAPSAPGWMRRGAFHDTAPVWSRGRIRSGYTSNVMFRRFAPAFAGLRFDLSLGTSGGEDTAFFSAAQARGARIVFAPDALLTEDVPAARARFGWLAQRRFRTGQTHGRLACEGRSVASRAAGAALAAAKVGFCLADAALHAAAPTARNRALLRGALHAGAVSGCLGARGIRLYGLPAAERVVPR